MKRVLLVLFAFIGIVAAAPSAQTAKPVATLTDVQVKAQIIEQSIANYAGSCPCPFNRDRAGRSCGRRSAYSRPGGAAPLCYEADVTPKMVADYKARAPKTPAAVAAGRR